MLIFYWPPIRYLFLRLKLKIPSLFLLPEWLPWLSYGGCQTADASPRLGIYQRLPLVVSFQGQLHCQVFRKLLLWMDNFEHAKILLLSIRAEILPSLQFRWIRTPWFSSQGSCDAKARRKSKYSFVLRRVFAEVDEYESFQFKVVSFGLGFKSALAYLLYWVYTLWVSGCHI